MSKILSSLVFWALVPDVAFAQITPDSSLGEEEKSVVNTNGNRDTINGGAVRNANLFHSFQEFNVEALREAYFANPDGIKNIFSRVTGNNLSDIQGVLGVLGNANLYLINPNGILFGENASLDVNGSFFATTADSVLFGNGFEFSAVNPDASPLLTIDIPIGLRFRDNPGDIVNRGSFQQVLPGETLAFIGGNVSVENGGILFAPGGRVELGGLVETGIIGIANNSSLSFPDGVARGNLSVTDSSIIAVFSGGGGSIGVNARNFNLTNGSVLLGGILATQGSVDAQAGDIIVNATESILIDGQSTGILGNVPETEEGNAGNIELNTSSLIFNNGAVLNASNLNKGNAGKITINATNDISLNNADILVNGSEGNAGNIEVNTGSLTLDNGVEFNARNLGQGNAGNVTINATDDVSLTNDSSIFVGASADNSGEIEINTSSLTLNNRATLLTGNLLGQGKGGNVTINATDDVSLNNSSGIFVGASADNSGEIEINTSSLILNNGATLNTSNFGQGKGGNVIINANDKLFFANNSGIVALASEGNSGNIEINTGSLTLNNEATLNTSNFGQGKGGNVIINANDNISFTNDSSILVTGSKGGSINISAKNLSLINDSAFLAGIDIDLGFADAQSGDIVINLTEDLILDGLNGEDLTSLINNNVGIGNAGNIEISARNISFTNGGNVISFSDGLGNSGDIIFKATENIAFDGNRNISLSGIQGLVTKTGEGVSGNITIDAQNLSLTNGASIATQVAGSGNSGNISINVKDSVTIDGETEAIELSDGTVGILTSSLKSNVIGSGNSGDINVTTQNLTITNGGNIFASIEGQGSAGKINLTTSKIFVDGRGSNTASAIDSSVLVGGIGNGGSIEITTEQFSLTSGALLSTSSAGEGDAGNISLSATDTFVVDDSLIVSNIGSPQKIPAVGKVGNIFIEAREIFFTNTAQIQAGSFPNATVEQPGMVSLIATESISFTGENTGIASNIEAGAVGNGSDIQLFAPFIFLSDGVVLAASNAGEGNGGNIEITTEQFSLTNGSGLTTSSLGQGDAGNIFISATDSFVAARSLVISNIGSPQEVQAVGKVGNIFIEARKISLTDGAQLQAGFFSQASGESGIVSVKAEDSISFTGENTGIFSNTEVKALGNASDIKLSAPSIFLGDGAVLIADNAGGGNGGNIELDANELQMNQGKISAATAFGTGGKINFQITDNLILQNTSLISARATNNADGGNVNIDSRFIVAFPTQNNDIIASAEQGDGGNIDITAEAIFGIQERSSTPPNNTNDIDASSQFGFSGTVNITQPTVDPASGLVDLTQDVVDPAKLITQNVCTQTANSEFIDIGKGGLPQSPEYVLAEDAIEVGLVAPIITSSEAREANKERREVKPRTTRKPPAQGWIWHENGMVELVAYNPNEVGEQRTWDKHRGCQN